jgi:hypothetical protein
MNCNRLKGWLLGVVVTCAIGVSLCSAALAKSAHPTIVINPRAYAWSPDGSRLLYADQHGLWTVGAPDFHHPVQLVRWNPFLDVAEVSWTPDGKRVAFVARRVGDDWDTVWVANADGSRLQDGVPVGSPISAMPQTRSLDIETWLDNQRVAVAIGCGTGYVCHYIANVESGEARDLCGNTGPFFWAANKQIAVSQNVPSISGYPQGLGLAVHGMRPRYCPTNGFQKSAGPPSEDVLTLDFAKHRDLYQTSTLGSRQTGITTKAMFYTLSSSTANRI